MTDKAGVTPVNLRVLKEIGGEIESLLATNAQLQQQAVELVEALFAAQDVICAEKCGGKHHDFCNDAMAVLVKFGVEDKRR